MTSHEWDQSSQRFCSGLKGFLTVVLRCWALSVVLKLRLAVLPLSKVLKTIKEELIHFYLPVGYKWPSKNDSSLCVGSRWRSNTFVLSTLFADIFLKIHLNNAGVRKQRTLMNFTAFFMSWLFLPWCVFAVFSFCSPSVKVTDWYPVWWPVIHPDKLPACWKPASHTWVSSDNLRLGFSLLLTMFQFCIKDRSLK